PARPGLRAKWATRRTERRRARAAASSASTREGTPRARARPTEPLDYSSSFDPRHSILVGRLSSSEQIIDEPHERPQEEQREYDGRDLERSLLSRKIVPAVRAFVRGGIDRQRAGGTLSVVLSHPDFP